MRCKWHMCGAEFAPTHGSQVFCSSKCRIERGKWKAVRGAALVEPLLAGDTEALERLRKEIKADMEART